MRQETARYLPFVSDRLPCRVIHRQGIIIRGMNRGDSEIVYNMCL